ncbi:Tc toxin subunit A-related protein [Psychroserpens sp.]
MLETAFYTHRIIRKPSNVLFDTYNDYLKRRKPSSAKITKIEYHITRGHELYHKRKYHDTLTEYNTALALIYQLMRPRFNPDLILGSDVIAAVKPEMFQPLFEISFTLLERVPDSIPSSIVNPPKPLDLLIDDTLRRYEGLGLVTEPIESIEMIEVEDAIRLGDLYISGEQFTEAAQHYSEALDVLGDSNQLALKASVQHNLGIAYVKTGQIDRAMTQMSLAEKNYKQVNEFATAGRVLEDIATVSMNSGRYQQAQSALTNASESYQRSSRDIVEKPIDSTIKASGQPTFSSHDLNNVVVRLEQQNNRLRSLQQRGSFIGRTWSRLRRGIETKPIELPQLEVQPILNGASHVTQPNLLNEATLSGASRVLRITGGLEVDNNTRLVEIALDNPNRVTVATESIYEFRKKAITLDQLGIYTGGAYLKDAFTLNIPHHYFFTLQMAIADTYKALGQYESALNHYKKARNYQYLNITIEAPNIWLSIAKCINDWAYNLYANNKVADALTLFQQVVDIAIGGAPSIPGVSPLYGQAPFNTIENAITDFFSTIDDVQPAVLNPDIEIEIRRARGYQLMIHAGLNVLGLPLDIIPIFRFQYLQSVARYFSEQAIKAEREYVSFMSASEQETANLMQLQQAVNLADATVSLEEKRVLEADAQLDVAEKSKDLAKLREENAKERKEEYGVLSADKIALDVATAHASGGFTETSGGYQVNLSTSGETVNLGDEDYEIMRSAAWHRGMIMREYEIDNMQRTIDEYAQYADVAEAQVGVAQARKVIAQENHKIAVLRKNQTEASLAYAQDKNFNAALWSNLAERMRQFSQLYMERAIEISYLMQAAYNFEMDANLEVIKNIYATGESLNGLLGADTLLADINYFTYHHITQTKSKEIPVKQIISLAERYPFSLYQFRRTGEVNFETKLEDFDLRHPGTYMRKIKAVEVYIEGIINADGISGYLRNSGVSVYRTRDNDVKLRIQPQETVMLSSYNLKQDIVVFSPSQETNGVFEGCGVATAWSLGIPRNANDLNYAAVSDIKLVVYYDAFHDKLLEDTVRANLPATGEWARTFSLRFNFPDAFFFLLEQGSTTIDIARHDFPFNQLNPKILRFAIYVITEEDIPSEGIKLSVSNELGTHTAEVETDANGIVTSDPADATNLLNIFHNDSTIDRWVINLDSLANSELFHEEPEGSGVTRVRGIKDIVLAIDYGYDVAGATVP